MEWKYKASDEMFISKADSSVKEYSSVMVYLYMVMVAYGSYSTWGKIEGFA